MPRRKRPISDLQAKIALKIIEFAQENELPEGYHLVENQLAKHLGVSRSPVRRTLDFLAKSGIVTAESNRGFFLAQSAGEIDGSSMRLPISEEDRLYSHIIDDRVHGKIDSDQTEVDLMRRYHAKRGAVTRVLWRLAKEGIVERGPGVGWTFMPTIDSVKTHDESYELRMVIEPAALLAPEFRIDLKKLARSREIHERMLCKGAKIAVGSEMFQINAEFHEMLASFSGNRFFLQIIEQQNRLRRLLEYNVRDSERIVDSCREHLAIIEALEANDREWAASLMRRHLARARKLATAAA